MMGNKKPTYEELEATVTNLQAQVQGLATENAVQDFIISAVKDLVRDSAGVSGWHLNGDIASWDEVLPELNHSETPQTDAALAEICAQGVEMFAVETIRIGEEEQDEDIIYAGKQAQLYAQQLRKEQGK